MAANRSRYDYQFDPNGESTAAKVCRLAGAGHHVLELGCAAGAMSAVLTNHYGCEVTGVEYDASAAELARRFCQRVVVGNLEQVGWHESLAGLQFDTIVAADVLEHLRDPLQCLRHVRKMLAPEGQLVVSVPNIAHSGVLAALLANDFPYRETGLLDRTHIHFFTALTLGNTLTSAGFSVEVVDTVDTGSWHPEFKQYWDMLPATVRDWLSANPAGKPFQIIMQARPHDAPPHYTDSLRDASEQWLAQTPRFLSVPSEATDSHLREEALNQRLAKTQDELTQALTRLAAIETSRSWRLTAPLRRLGQKLIHQK
jgi:2-polyprenyl-3-methyl-5-hydroxy-6-metoxy-1,4-benzoquinol methylase